MYNLVDARHATDEGCGLITGKPEEECRPRIVGGEVSHCVPSHQFVSERQINPEVSPKF